MPGGGGAPMPRGICTTDELVATDLQIIPIFIQSLTPKYIDFYNWNENYFYIETILLASCSNLRDKNENKNRENKLC
jgi:hypothetical protein